MEVRLLEVDQINHGYLREEEVPGRDPLFRIARRAAKVKGVRLEPRTDRRTVWRSAYINPRCSSTSHVVVRAALARRTAEAVRVSQQIGSEVPAEITAAAIAE